MRPKPKPIRYATSAHKIISSSTRDPKTGLRRSRRLNSKPKKVNYSDFYSDSQEGSIQEEDQE